MILGLSVGVAIFIVKKSKGAYKKWELSLMTIIIASGILLDYANVTIVINISEAHTENLNILRNTIQKSLYPYDVVKEK